MRSMKFAAGAVAVCLGLGMTLASANAQQVASVSTCLERASQLKTALDGNAQSANYQDATKEGLYGRAFCNNGFYAKGVARYDHALQMLGQNADAAATH